MDLKKVEVQQPTAEEINNTIQDIKNFVETLKENCTNYEIEKDNLKKIRGFIAICCAIVIGIVTLTNIAFGIATLVNILAHIGIYTVLAGILYNRLTKDERKLVNNFDIEENENKISCMKKTISILEKKHEFLKSKENAWEKNDVKISEKPLTNNFEPIITKSNENLEEKIYRKDKQKTLVMEHGICEGSKIINF